MYLFGFAFIQIVDAMKNDAQSCEWIPDLSKAVDIPRLLLVCGGDLLETFSTPGLWQDEDVSTFIQFSLLSCNVSIYFF